MYKHRETRQRILQSALELASVRGLAGVSLGQLAEQAHLSKSGLFAHFRSKEALELELLDAAFELFQQAVISPAEQEPEGLPRLRALVNLWLGWAPRSGLPGGCPFVGATSELDDGEGPVREHLVESQRTWFGILQQATRRAVELGQLRADLDTAQFTWEVFGIYLIHHASSRLMRDPRADQRAQTAFESLVRAAQPDAA